DVEAEVLERRVEDLLRGAIEPMDLVDEENVARLESGEDRGVVFLRDGGSRDGTEPHAELLTDDLRERRLAEARGAREKHVVARLRARPRGLESDPELLRET